MKLFRPIASALLAGLFATALVLSNAPAQGQIIGARIAVNVTATTYTFACVPPDTGKLVAFNNSSAIAVTLPAAGTSCFQQGWYAYVSNINTGTVTITPTNSFIGQAATLTLTTGTAYMIINSGTNYELIR